MKAEVRSATLGSNRGKNRLWLQSSKVAGWLQRAGFKQGARYSVAIKPNKVVMTLGGKDADRKVARKNDQSIIDINTDQLQFSRPELSMRLEKGRITITPAKGKK